MTDKKKQNIESGKKSTFSPSKYITSTIKEVTYTTQKLYQNFIYKEVISNKKIEQQKKKTRQYEAQNKMHLQKIAQLNIQIKTVRHSLNQQIQMYQKMIKDLEIEKRKHIQRTQEEFKIELQSILESHEEVAKVQQAKQEELQTRISELLIQIQGLRSDLRNNDNLINGLRTKGQGLQNQLRHTKQLLSKSQAAHNKSIQLYKAEIEGLNKNSAAQKQNQKNYYEAALSQKHKQIQNLLRVHKLQLQKQESRRINDITNKTTEFRQIKSQFQAQKSGLQQLVQAKDSANQRLTQEIQKQKEYSVKMADHFERQSNQLTQQIQNLKHDLRILNQTNTTLKMTNSQLENDNISLADQIRKLRQVLMESSLEMDKCREQFIRLDGDRQRLRRQLIDCQKQLQRAKDILIEKQQQSRNWMENYFALKSRF